MADHSVAVIPSHPPQVVMRVMNSALRHLLGTPVGRALKDFMVLEVTGRKSGRRFSIPVSAHVIDGQLYALAGSLWAMNFRGGAPTQVVHNGRTTTMRGELVEDGAEVAELFHRCAVGYGPRKAQRSMGLKFRDSRVPTLEEFRQAVDENGFVAIRLATQPTPHSPTA